VGDRLDSQNLPREEFDSVLNVGVEVPILHDLACLHLPMEHERSISIELFEQARHFLSEAERHGHKVFVHCKVGQSRSPAVVAVWLAIRNKVDFETALGWVRDKRNGVYLIPEVMKSADEYVKWYAARPAPRFLIDR
jgi:protein-tyrosine phosphatase